MEPPHPHPAPASRSVPLRPPCGHAKGRGRVTRDRKGVADGVGAWARPRAIVWSSRCAPHCCCSAVCAPRGTNGCPLLVGVERARPEKACRVPPTPARDRGGLLLQCWWWPGLCLCAHGLPNPPAGRRPNHNLTTSHWPNAHPSPRPGPAGRVAARAACVVGLTASALHVRVGGYRLPQASRRLDWRGRRPGVALARPGRDLRVIMTRYQ